MSSARQQQDGQVRSPRKGRLRSFVKNRDGVTVIEFALLALPFSLLIFAILESCISFAAEVYLQNVTDDLARELRTGQIKKGEITKEEFRKKICDRLEVAFVSAGCPGLEFDLRNFGTFADAAALKNYVTSQGEIFIDGGTFQFDPGPSQSKNMLRVYYRWPVITDIMRSRMSTLKDDKNEYSATLHFATATWQNEPFPD